MSGALTVACQLLNQCVLLAGADSRAIFVPQGIPLSGYGSIHRRDFWSNAVSQVFRFSRAPALFFKSFESVDGDGVRIGSVSVRGQGAAVTFVSLELVAVTADFVQKIKDTLAQNQAPQTNLIVTATHTHSGPGGLASNSVWQVGAADTLNSEFLDSVVQQTAASIRNSLSRQQPVTMESMSIPVTELNQNRRINGGPAQRNVNLLQFRSAAGKHVIAGLLHYAIHGTALGTKSLVLSADIPGRLVRTIESLHPDHPSFVYLSGAAADVSPTKSGLNGLTELSDSFRAQLTSADVQNEQKWTKNKSVLEYSERQVSLPPPILNLQKCDVLSGYSASFLPTIRASMFPTVTTVQKIKIGDVTFQTWPGEPIAEIGNMTSNLLITMANDYLGYFVTPSFVRLKSYESCANIYGVWAWEQMLEAGN
jgi:Neutral/alkaline non-lysosomal ceramidase, N-terminal